MKYSLVLQFPANGPEGYDKLIEVEEALVKYLRGLADVDGHDCVGGEMNIFIFTDKPEETFEEAKVVVKAADLLTTLLAAYRLVTEEEYSRLWPNGSSEPFVVV